MNENKKDANDEKILLILVSIADSLKGIKRELEVMNQFKKNDLNVLGLEEMTSTD